MLELLRTRRSTRRFTADNVPAQTVERLIEAALRAPSSRGGNPWEFVIIDTPELLEQLSQAKQHGSEFLKNAPLAIVVCADSTKSDVWVEDCTIAAIILQLTAHAEGLGSCWAQIRNRQHNAETSAESYLQQLLGLPADIKVECVLGIGYPVERQPPVPASSLQYGKIKRNRWS